MLNPALRPDADPRHGADIVALPLAATPARPPRDAAELSILSDGSPLRWRYGERLETVLEEACRRHADRAAVATAGAEISYRDLDARANQMARLLIARGVQPGDRIAVLLDRGLDAYVALFALLKAGAVYVPLDSNHPADRLRHILADSEASLVLCHLRLADRFSAFAIPTLIVDTARADMAAFDSSALRESEKPLAASPLCYILYTSGTTGQPKGVAVAHPSICNFVRVAAELYGFGPGDRVYQGMSIAFDFSVEELWVPLVAGATLTPNEAATSLFGEELADFLESQGVTCFCCVPTLLASIERDLPGLRVLLIGGEACPPALVKRWSRKGRALLNSYGPTETTVTATLGRMSPDKPITIGTPLPTYSIVILDPKRPAALGRGESGEIGIAGIGVAEGYLNRDELTAAKFIPDVLALANNPSGRIYRTGDLGRLTEDGEIEFLGRIDTQVKLRGYRIELTEIESVLLELPEIAQAVVTTFEPEPGDPELVAYYSAKHGQRAPEPATILAHLRARLPVYMTPAYLERLPFIPTLVSNKADREKLPAPKTARLRISESHAAPTTDTERALCAALGHTLGLEEVSIDGDFFTEYGAHSLLMARFCAKIRHIDPALHIAMRDVYTNPTVRRLARAIDAREPVALPEAPPEPAAAVSDRAYYATGAAQLAAYGLAGLIAVGFSDLSFQWTFAAASPLALYGRALLVVCTGFFGLNALAVLARRALLGANFPRVFTLWSLAYFRFWVVKELIAVAPAGLFLGSPLYNIFLRALGARIGRGAVIDTRAVPVAAHLFCVGEDAVLFKRTAMPGYFAQGNRIHLGTIHIGRHAFVGEGSVLDIDASIGDFGQLGHASSLRAGQRIPEGKRYAGSPAEETATNFRLADAIPAQPYRRTLFGAAQLIGALAVTGALGDVLATSGLEVWGADSSAAAAGHAPLATALALLGPTLAGSLVLFAGPILLGLASIFAIPRLAHLFLEEGRIYPLFGFHHAMQRLIETTSNSAFFNALFGDSALIEPYLRFIGWKLAPSVSTGSNFGSEQRHDNPFLCQIGAGAVASDGLTMGNVSMSSQAFRLSVAKVGANSFLGSDVYIAPGSRVGDNCLLATKVMTPIDGPIRENVGLLGSPAFEIPRAASRDLEALAGLDAPEKARRVSRKLRHNLASTGMTLASHWTVEFVGLFAITWTADVWGANNVIALTIAGLAAALFAVVFYALVERASTGFSGLKPEMATVYDPAFWRIERHWKLSESMLTSLFPGTPMRNALNRLMGARVGRRVFDDGCTLTERTLARIDDEANLNAGAVVQTHSLEEGVFKSDYTRLGARCTLGPNAFIHYGVTLHEGACVDADSFLMKGEVAPAGSRWRGNPAKLVVAGATRPALKAP